MPAAVDARAMLVRDGDAAIAFTLDCVGGTAVLDPGGDPLGVRTLSWGEKCALARFAGAGAAFVERQFVGICAPGLGDRADRAAALALLMWLHAPSAEAAAAALPLDALLLAGATAALCPALGIGPAELAARPAPEVELLWRAQGVAREAAREAPALRTDDATTRILIEPDPAEPHAADEPQPGAARERAAPAAAGNRRVDARAARVAGDAPDPIVAAPVAPTNPPEVGGTAMAAAPGRANAAVTPPRAPTVPPGADAQRARAPSADEPARLAAEDAPDSAPSVAHLAAAVRSGARPPPPSSPPQAQPAPQPAQIARAPETPLPQAAPPPAHAAPAADLTPPPSLRAPAAAQFARPQPSPPPPSAPALPAGRVDPAPPPAPPPLDPRLAALIAFVGRAPEADRADADADADPAAPEDAFAEELAAAAAELGIVRAG